MRSEAEVRERLRIIGTGIKQMRALGRIERDPRFRASYARESVHCEREAELLRWVLEGEPSRCEPGCRTHHYLDADVPGEPKE